MAQNSSGPNILSSKGMVAGETVAQWTQDWWTWVLQSPDTANPTEDPTGAFATNNNGAAMFFIAGTDGGFAERSFTVPHAKPLLVPVLNQFDTLDPKSIINKVLADFQTGVTDMFARIDNIPVSNLQSHLVRTDFFSMGTVRDHTVASALGAPIGADLSPTKSAGYWLVVDGLAPGSHTLDFGGSLSNGFSTHVVDHITVA
jgi:hypothetical protein